MAVRDEYVDTTHRNADGSMKNGPSDNIRSIGAPVFYGENKFTLAAADDDASIFRLATLPSGAVLIDVKIATTGITAGTDYVLGFYDPKSRNSGAVVSANVLMATTTMASAADFGNPTALDGMDNVAVADQGRLSIGDLLAKSISATPRTMQNDYDLALTANTIGSGTGDIAVQYWYCIP